MKKAREFALSWIHSFKDGEFVETTQLIVENPTKDDLENSCIHVIEATAAVLAAEEMVSALEELCSDWERFHAEASEECLILPDVANRKRLHDNARAVLLKARGGG